MHVHVCIYMSGVTVYNYTYHALIISVYIHKYGATYVYSYIAMILCFASEDF